MNWVQTLVAEKSARQAESVTREPPEVIVGKVLAHAIDPPLSEALLVGCIVLPDRHGATRTRCRAFLCQVGPRGARLREICHFGAMEW